MYCWCGRKLPKDGSNIYIFYCKCGRKYLWKIRSRRWVYAGRLQDVKEDASP